MSAGDCLTDIPTLDLLIELSVMSADVKLTLALAVFSNVSQLSDESVELLTARPHVFNNMVSIYNSVNVCSSLVISHIECS